MWHVALIKSNILRAAKRARYCDCIMVSHLYCCILSIEDVLLVICVRLPLSSHQRDINAYMSWG